MKFFLNKLPVANSATTMQLMQPLTRQDLTEVVEAVLERRFETWEKRVDAKLELRFGSIEARLGNIEQRLDNVEQRLDNIEQRLDKVGQRLGTLETEFGVFREIIEDRFDGLADAIQVVNDGLRTCVRQSDLQLVRYDIQTIKIAVRATNDDLWR